MVKLDLVSAKEVERHSESKDCDSKDEDEIPDGEKDFKNDADVGC